MLSLTAESAFVFALKGAALNCFLGPRSAGGFVEIEVCLTKRCQGKNDYAEQTEDSAVAVLGGIFRYLSAG